MRGRRFWRRSGRSMGRREGKCGGKKGSSQKVGGEQTRGLGKAPKAARGRSMKARPTQSRKGVKGGLRPFSSAPCRVKGQRPLWGLGQRPNSSTGVQYAKRAQQRCRQRSVPASNFARPQTRPQAALPPRFREAPVFLLHLVFEKRRASLSTCSAFDLSLADYLTSSQSTISPVKMSRI